jgi:hypothetical protein
MPSTNHKKVINITPNVAGQKVKEIYEVEAQRRGRLPRLFVSDAIAYACRNKSRFKTPLIEAKPKNGSHISILLDKEIKEDLMIWAEEQRSNQSLWANYILEKILELELLGEI